MQIKDFLNYAIQELEPFSETAHIEVQVLLAHLLNKDRTWVLAHPEWEISPPELEVVKEDLQKLIRKMPLAYIIGEREFFSLPFWVNESVLIPRPETELLVEYALDWLKRHSQAEAVLDVGTGSGCIAVSLAYHQPRIRVVGVDISWRALQIARCNSQRHRVSAAIAWLQSDLCLPLINSRGSGAFDLICANLPYVPSGETKQCIGEPQLALDGGDDGLAVLRRFLPQAAKLLKPHSLLLLEIGAGQNIEVEKLVLSWFPQASVTFINDLAGIKRVCAVQTN